MVETKKLIILPLELFFNLHSLLFKVREITQNPVRLDHITDGAKFRGQFSGNRRAIEKSITPKLLVGEVKGKVQRHIKYGKDKVVLSYSCARTLALKFANVLEIDHDALISSNIIPDYIKEHSDYAAYDLSKKTNFREILQVLTLTGKTEVEKVTDELILSSLNNKKVSTTHKGKSTGRKGRKKTTKKAKPKQEEPTIEREQPEEQPEREELDVVQVVEELTEQVLDKLDEPVLESE